MPLAPRFRVKEKNPLPCPKCPKEHSEFEYEYKLGWEAAPNHGINNPINYRLDGRREAWYAGLEDGRKALKKDGTNGV